MSVLSILGVILIAAGVTVLAVREVALWSQRQAARAQLRDQPRTRVVSGRRWL